MNLSSYQILSTLDRLGIKIEDHTPSNKGWVSILCPNPQHYDNYFGNCSININTGVTSCFSCGYKKNIYNVVMDNLNYSFKEAKQFIEEGIGFSQKQRVIQQKIPKIYKKELYNFTHTALFPEKYYYTSQRKITKSFCEQFNIVHCLSGWYDDYFIIPITDKQKNINEYEARKLKEKEYLEKYFDTKEDYFLLKKRFELVCKNKKIRYKKDGLYINDVKAYDSDLIYLLKNKTLYIQNSQCQETLWNIDNLDRNNILYVVEGLGSVCQIYENISTNVTALFGVSITDAQLEYLKQFKKIYFIPDYDKAGYDAVDFLNKKERNNIQIINIQKEDTDDDYINAITKTIPISMSKYLLGNFKKFKLNL